jgi:LPS export ABC transporter protein LptC
MKKLLLAFIALSLGGLATALYFSGGGDERVPPTPTPENLLAVIEKVRYSGFSGDSDGHLEWELEADSAEMMRDDDLTVFKGVKVVFFSRSGDAYTLTGREASFDESDGVIRFSGDVTFVNGDTRSDEHEEYSEPRKAREPFSNGWYNFSADSVEYSTKSRRVSSVEAVRIESDEFLVTGRGLEVDVEGGGFTILKDAKTVMKNGIIEM